MGKGKDGRVNERNPAPATRARYKSAGGRRWLLVRSFLPPSPSPPVRPFGLDSPAVIYATYAIRMYLSSEIEIIEKMYTYMYVYFGN